MENQELQVFKNEVFGNVRTLTTEDGKILFVANDVAKALGYTNPSKATNDHCKKAIRLRGNDSLGRKQEYKFIPEGDIYRLISRSKLPNAEKFESWVFDEVLPSIRKHGAYMTPETLDEIISNPEFGIRLLTELKNEKEARQVAENKNKLLNDENEALSKDILEWADEKIINAIVRRYGSTFGEFGKAWIEFKKNILYKYSINIESRITNYLNNTGKKTRPKTLSMLRTPEELTKGLKTAISMCRDENIDISDLLEKHLKD